MCANTQIHTHKRGWLYYKKILLSDHSNSIHPITANAPQLHNTLMTAFVSFIQKYSELLWPSVFVEQLYAVVCREEAGVTFASRLAPAARGWRGISSSSICCLAKFTKTYGRKTDEIIIRIDFVLFSWKSSVCFKYNIMFRLEKSSLISSVVYTTHAVLLGCISLINIYHT